MTGKLRGRVRVGRWLRSARRRPGRVLAAAVLAAAGLSVAATAVSCSTTRPPAAAPPPPRPPTASVAPVDPRIRVLLAENAPTLQLSVAGPCRIADARGRTVREFPSGLPATPVPAAADGIVFSAVPYAFALPDSHTVPASTGSHFGADWLDVVPASPTALATLGGRRYRGSLRLLRAGGGLSAINLLDVEDYLPGVLAGELPRGWAAEAYKAQAVASRTFVLWEKARRPASAPFDVRATVASQMYVGADDSPHAAEMRRAVAATAGQVLTCDGQLIHAYFCSTCGGMNEPADHAWPREPMNAALAGGSACSWCSISPKYRWGPVVWPKDKLLAKLRRKDPAGFGPGFGTLAGIEPAGRTRSGRPVDLRIRGSSGAVVTMNAYQFRLAVSEGEPRERVLPSSHVEIADKGATLSFTGRGYGHGVGLCQYGSQAQAAAGRDYRQILGLYYPGAALAKLR